MARRAKTRLAGTLSVILPSMLLCGAATSQTLDTQAGSDGVANAQVQSGDVFAGQTLDVVDAAGALTATTAVGNSVSATGTGTPLGFLSGQVLSGSVGSDARLNAAGYVNNVLATTSSTGNTATAGTCCGALTGASAQVIDWAKDVTASTKAQLNYADSAGVDTTAVGNTQGWNSTNGASTTATYQSHGGATRAKTKVKANVVYGDAAYTASAVANNVTVDSTHGPVVVSVEQHADGPTSSAVSVDQGYAYNLLAAASATGNNVNVGASDYAAQMRNDQTNGGAIDATADVNLNSWYGSGTALAYGMANSAILSNNGSYAGVDNYQTNTGDVTVRGSFTGGAGGDALASATAIGNAVSGYACADCQGTFNAGNAQVNGGAVRATSSFTSTGSMGTATGVATAVGNTATFQVRRNGG